MTLNSSGCTSAAALNAVVNTVPGAPSAPVVGSITQPTCTTPTGSVALSGLPSGAWTINPGAIAGSGTSTTISNLNPGTYNFTVTLNSSGCSSPAALNAVVNIVPATQPLFTQISQICFGESFSLPTTSNNGLIGVWSPVENFNTTTNYIFTPNANQCAASATMTVTVLSASTPTFSNPGPLCSGDPLILPSTSNEGILGSWSPAIDNTTTTTYTFTPNTGQCATTSTLTVLVYAIPSAAFSPNINQGCAPLTVNFTNMSPGSSQCTWNLGNGNVIQNSSSLSYTFQQAGCYDISLTVTTQEGCSGTTTATDLICVSDIPVADFNVSTYFIDEFNTFVNFENTSIGATNYIWYFGDNSTISTSENTSHNYMGNNVGEYLVTLVASSPQGCIDTAYATIYFQDQLVYYIPNAFTPDEDEYNQTFQPVFTSGFDPDHFEFFIYNRWGELIFESQNPNYGWNGSIDNDTALPLCPDGVYTWKVIFRLNNNDDRKTAVGHVNLIR